VPGDVNGDGAVNKYDLSFLSNYLQGPYRIPPPPAPDPLCRGDVDGNCAVNGIDVTYLDHYLRYGNPAPLCRMWGSDLRMAYDENGNRIKKKGGGYCGEAQYIDVYVYSGEKMLAKADDNGYIKETYIYAGNDRIAVRNSHTGETRFFLKDHLGSTRVIVNESGDMTASYVYGPYGEDYAFSEAYIPFVNQGSEFKYTGQIHDDDEYFSMYYYGARYYDPTLGIFWQVDPAMDNYPGWSPYAYTLDNPLKYVDPDGRFIWLLFAGGVAGGILKGWDYANAPGPGDKIYVKSPLENLRDTAEGVLIGGMACHTIGKALEAGNLVSDNPEQPSQNAPNPYGPKGNPDHQQKVEKLGEKARSEKEPGEEVLQERKMQGHDSNRRPDQQIVDKTGKTRKVFEAERKPNSKYNKEREAEYDKLGIEHETHLLDEDKR